jgi:hypothetical protein
MAQRMQNHPEKIQRKIEASSLRPENWMGKVHGGFA